MFLSSLISIIIFYSVPDDVAGRWWPLRWRWWNMVAAVVTASSLVALLSAREYKYGGGFDAGDGDGKGFGGDGKMLMASALWWW